jgi:hypothetical protein
MRSQVAHHEGSNVILGRKNYTQEELDHCKTAVDEQLAAYRALVNAIRGATGAEPARVARA